jgi:hypothetical protein
MRGFVEINSGSGRHNIVRRQRKPFDYEHAWLRAGVGGVEYLKVKHGTAVHTCRVQRVGHAITNQHVHGAYVRESGAGRFILIPGLLALGLDIVDLDRHS